jgi:integrase
MPFLVKSATGVPLEAPTYWITSKRRPAGKQPNTLANDLRALVYFYLWADARGIDVVERLRTGKFFTLTEINDLDSFCGRYLPEALSELPGPPTNVLPFKPQNKNRHVRTRNVNLLEKRNRLMSIYSFLEYTSADYLSRLNDNAERWSHYDGVRGKCLVWISGRFKAIAKRTFHDIGDREALDSESLIRLRQVIEPDHPENPFEPHTRFRNLLIVKLLLDLGLRRGELLGLRVADCKLGGSKGTIEIHRRPDDPDDPRMEQPASKTAARMLPLNARLTELVHEWVVHHRTRTPEARKHGFLITNSSDGRPLSLSSINKLFLALRRRVPGLPDSLSPHVLRHSWNDAFSDEMDKKGIDGHQESKWRARLMGWRREESAHPYLTRTIRKRSNDALTEIHDKLDIRVAHHRKENGP